MLRYHRVLGSMKPIFANPNPINYSYDSGGDVIYIAFADQKVARTVELVSGWPILLVDLNDANQIIGIECVGIKQFGVDTFVRLLQEHVKRAFGMEMSENEAESFVLFLRSPEAELALSN